MSRKHALNYNVHFIHLNCILNTQQQKIDQFDQKFNQNSIKKGTSQLSIDF